MPHPTEAAAKIPKPVMKIRRRPTWSAKAPPISSRDDIHRVYELMTQVIAESVVCSSDSILGSATLTTEESMNAILDPSTQAANTQVCFCFTQGVTSGVDRMINSSHGLALSVLMGIAPLAAGR
jgi:hypothetical protein